MGIVEGLHFTERELEQSPSLWRPVSRLRLDGQTPQLSPPCQHPQMKGLSSLLPLLLWLKPPFSLPESSFFFSFFLIYFFILLWLMKFSKFRSTI